MTQTLGQQVHDVAVRLRPTALDDLGLVPALRSYIEDWSEQTKIIVEVCDSGMEGKRLPIAIETTLYRIVQEALNNVCKHARASSVTVILARQRRTLSQLLKTMARVLTWKQSAKLKREKTWVWIA